MLNKSEWNLSKNSLVILQLDHLTYHSAYSLGMPLSLKLWMRHLMLTLGKAPFTSRSSVNTTWFFCQVSLTVLVSKWMELVVVHPGQVLK